MRTPKEYTKLVKQGVLTDQIIAECIYSVNKRAKNCRDMVDAYWYAYEYRQKYIDKKDEYYRMKENMLTLYQPICIHRQTLNVYRRRARANETGYQKRKKKFEKDIVEIGMIYSKKAQKEVEYFDYLDRRDEKTLYFLFYEIGEYSFHKPISKKQKKKYPELKIIQIDDDFYTYGKDTNELLSVQFVKQVLQLIKSGNYTYQKSNAKKKEKINE